MGFPGGSDSKASACNAGDLGSIPGLGRSPGEGKWQPTPVLLPRKFNGWRSLVGYSPWGCKQSDVTEQFHFHKIGNFHQIMSKFSSAVELFDSPIRPITCANHQDEVHNLASLQPMHSVPMEKVKRLYLSVRFSSVTQSCLTLQPHGL